MNDPKTLQEIAEQACIFDRAHFDDDTAPTPETLLSNHARLPSDRKLITRLRPRYAVALGFFEGYATALELERSRVEESERAMKAMADEVRDFRSKTIDELRSLQNRIERLPTFAYAMEVRGFVKETIARLTTQPEQADIGIVKKPPPPPPPAAPPKPEEISDELAQAAAEFANRFGSPNQRLDVEAVKKAAVTPYAKREPYEDRAVFFIEGARWQRGFDSVELAAMKHALTEGADSIGKLLAENDRLEKQISETEAERLTMKEERDRALAKVRTWETRTGEMHPRIVEAKLDEMISDVCTPNESQRWVRLHALREGAVFETAEGIRAVKSEYHYPNGGIECVLIASGEYAHFGDTAEKHNDVLVRQIVIPDRQAPPGTSGVVRTVLVDLAERMGDHSLNVEMQEEHLIDKIIEFVDYLREYQPKDHIHTELCHCTRVEPIVFRSDDERDFWDEQVHALNRRGDRSTMDVANAADEMVEERRKRMSKEEPKELPIVSETPMRAAIVGVAKPNFHEPEEAGDDLLAEAVEYANEFCEEQPSDDDLNSARAAVKLKHFGRWSSTVRTYVDGALRKHRKT
jgi:hypothetical protein